MKNNSIIRGVIITNKNILKYIFAIINKKTYSKYYVCICLFMNKYLPIQNTYWKYSYLSTSWCIRINNTTRFENNMIIFKRYLPKTGNFKFRTVLNIPTSGTFGPEHMSV